MKHRDGHPKGALVATLVILLALVAGWGHHASLQAQPLFTSAPSTAQHFINRGQVATIVYTITNNSTLARTISAGFVGVPAGLLVALQSTVNVPPQSSMAVPLIVAAEVSAPMGQYVILVDFRGLGGDTSVLSASSALIITVGAYAPTVQPTASPPYAPTAAPPYDTSPIPRRTATPAALRDRYRLPYVSQPPRSAALAPTAPSTATRVSMPTPTVTIPTSSPGPRHGPP